MARTVAMVIAGTVVAATAPSRAAEPAAAVAPPVTVSATPLDTSASQRLIGARVISRRDIEQSRAGTLSDLLSSSAALRTRELQGSPNPQLDLRGFDSFGDQNALVLLDGVRAREYEQLSVNWGAIPLASIERIEILPASASVLYGGGATGGVLNVVTRSPQAEPPSAYVGGGAGSFDTREARAGGSIASGSVGVRVHGSQYETDNYRVNNRVRIDSAQADMRWSGAASDLSLRVGADDQYNGLPGVLSEAQIAADRRQASTPGDFASQDGGFVNLAANTTAGPGELSATIGYRRRDTASSFLVGTPLRNNVDTRVRVWSASPRLQLKPGFGGKDDALIVGGNFEDWSFDADAGPVIVGRPHSTQRTKALYGQHTITFATGTTFGAGVRAQHAQYGVRDRARPSASGRRKRTLYAWDISVRQALARAVVVYARRGNSFRLPNVNDNYNPFFARVTLLEPQTARDMEIGIEGSSGSLSYRALAYRISLDNEIYFDPVTLGSLNRQPTRRQGVELEAGWQVLGSFSLHVNYLYADARFRAGQVGGVSIDGNRVPLAPRHIVRAGAQWWVSDAARVDFDVRRVGSSVFDADELNAFSRRIPAYTVADVKLRVRSGAWLLNAGVRNLFGKEYFSYGVFTGRPTYSAFPAAERTAFVSAQYTFR